MSGEKVVYTITVFSGDPTKFRIRDWGYYFKQEDAARVIEDNETDISELDYYHFALLAAKGEGPAAIGEPIQWYEFKWNGDTFLRADKVECPEIYDHVCV
jgi:hypothetical protein